jgi:phosphoglycolate phosphatase/putative hydrolase of the HAD superfamily
LAAEQTGTDPADVAALAHRWMEQLPLDVIAKSIRPGLLQLLDVAAAGGLRMAAVSDYPAQQKLLALGVADRFDVVLSAQDPRVCAFKPDPRGLLVALDELGVDHTEALYIGDRVDVDAAAAAAARVRCVLVGGARHTRGAPTPRYVDFALLARTLEQR